MVSDYRMKNSVQVKAKIKYFENKYFYLQILMNAWNKYQVVHMIVKIQKEVTCAVVQLDIY